MRKWAFIQKDNGSVECWRYIDSLVDVRPYWYIMDAIHKYGYDDVMPIMMNRVGGYHSARGDNIITIIEAETEPSLDQKDQYMKIRNNPNFDCGWIGPDGTTYFCNEYGHLDLAEELCNLFFENSSTMDCRINAPDEFLVNHGFIKIYEGKRHYCLWQQVSKEAAKVLEELEKKWHV